jgi:hypothetical protein
MQKIPWNSFSSSNNLFVQESPKTPFYSSFFCYTEVSLMYQYMKIVFFLSIGTLFFSGFPNEASAVLGKLIGSKDQVYTMSNSPSGNEVLVFKRGLGGNLRQFRAFPTGGLGTGGSLGNQGGIILDPSFRWLFVVNAGNATISHYPPKRIAWHFGSTRIMPLPSKAY